MEGSVTTAHLLALQAHAIATNDQGLRYDTYDALGFCVRYGAQPLEPWERERALARCKQAAEMIGLMGGRL
jgi:hypothetical protein